MGYKSRFSDSDRTPRNLPGDHSNGDCYILDVYSEQQRVPKDYAQGVDDERYNTLYDRKRRY